MTINQAALADSLIEKLYSELTKKQQKKLLKIVDLINKDK